MWRTGDTRQWVELRRATDSTPSHTHTPTHPHPHPHTLDVPSHARGMAACVGKLTDHARARAAPPHTYPLAPTRTAPTLAHTPTHPLTRPYTRASMTIISNTQTQHWQGFEGMGRATDHSRKLATARAAAPSVSLLIQGRSAPRRPRVADMASACCRAAAMASGRRRSWSARYRSGRRASSSWDSLWRGQGGMSKEGRWKEERRKKGRGGKPFGWKRN